MVRKCTLCNFISFKFVEIFFSGPECSLSWWMIHRHLKKIHTLDFFWMECSIMRILLVDCVLQVFCILTDFWSDWSISCWEGCIKVLNYNYGFNNFSFQLFQLLLHVFWDSVVWHIEDYYVFLGVDSFILICL